MTWCDWERGNLHAVIELVHRLEAAEDGMRLIIRPHPAENLNHWHDYLGETPRRSIIREGDHLAWSAGAELVLHTSCTTGMEAALIGTPALSLMPGDNPWHGFYIANLINETARTVDEAVEKILGHWRGAAAIDPISAHTQAAWSDHLAIDAGGDASSRVVEALEEVAAARGLTFGGADAIHLPVDRTMGDWQRAKIDLTREAVQSELRNLMDQLGLRVPFVVEELADSVMMVRPTSGGGAP